MADIRAVVVDDEPLARERLGRLLREDPKLPGVRVRELLEPLGCSASKTVVDDYLREVRPLFGTLTGVADHLPVSLSLAFSASG